MNFRFNKVVKDSEYISKEQILENSPSLKSFFGSQGESGIKAGFRTRNANTLVAGIWKWQILAMTLGIFGGTVAYKAFSNLDPVKRAKLEEIDKAMLEQEGKLLQETT